MKRNKKIDCIKLIASCFVVLIHIMLPDDIGTIFKTIARFAVPLFFCITGYFTYGLTAKAIKKRIIYIIKLQIVASGIYGLWEIWKCIFIYDSSPLQYLQSVFSIKRAGLYIIDQINPFSGHLWYLSALMFCYLILLIYVIIAMDNDGHIDYKNLYLISCSFLSVMLFMCNYICIDKDYEVHYKTFRNALYIGFPFIVLGLFIRQYKDVLLSRLEWNWKKGILFIIIGFAASIIQEYTLGEAELPIGMLMVVPSIILISISDDIPEPPISNTLSRMLNDTSLVVYIIHILINNILTEYRESSALIQKFFSHPYLYPGFIIVCSISLGIIYSVVKLKLRKKHSDNS